MTLSQPKLRQLMRPTRTSLMRPTKTSLTERMKSHEQCVKATVCQEDGPSRRAAGCSATGGAQTTAAASAKGGACRQRQDAKDHRRRGRVAQASSTAATRNQP